MPNRETSHPAADRPVPRQERLDIGADLDRQAEIDFTGSRTQPAPRGSQHAEPHSVASTAPGSEHSSMSDPVNGSENQDFFGDEEAEHLIEIGDEVTLVYDDQPQRPIVVRISANDDEPEKGLLHRNKPLSQALLGNAAEDVVEVPLDRGTRTATILRVVKLDEAV